MQRRYCPDEDTSPVVYPCQLIEVKVKGKGEGEEGKGTGFQGQKDHEREEGVCDLSCSSSGGPPCFTNVVMGEVIAEGMG